MRRMMRSTGAILALALASASAGEARAQPPGGAREPPVSAVVAEALRYFRVNPEAVDSVRSSSRWRALMPLVAGGFRYDDDKFARNEVQAPSPLTSDESTNRRINSFSVGAVWDLREAVFNPAEVQAYGLIGIQRDIMLEVTRNYYLRRQLMLLRTQKPPEDPVTLATLDLRIEEFTALLDVYTGGWFSRASGATPAPAAEPRPE